MNLLRKSLLFGILIFIVFVIWSYVENNVFNLADNTLRALIFAFVYALFTGLFEKKTIKESRSPN
ncbi:hypothetical protein B5V89_18555 [Heyndrickxia sporothermodurans]|nr:hypothetical protein B5V89_18555 [Heyndrickxia sporothermodurans]